MFPVTEPFSVLLAVAVFVLKAFDAFDVAVAPLLAAAAPTLEASALPNDLLLFWSLLLLLLLF